MREAEQERRAREAAEKLAVAEQARARAEACASKRYAERPEAEAAAELELVAEERAKAEARLQSLSARRWPVLLAVASAVVLSLLLGIYVGWRQSDVPPQGVIGGGEPLKLRLERSLQPKKP